MNRQILINLAIADREKGWYNWFDLKAKYPELTIDEIFCDVIGQCNSQLHKDALALENERQAQKNR